MNNKKKSANGTTELQIEEHFIYDVFLVALGPTILNLIFFCVFTKECSVLRIFEKRVIRETFIKTLTKQNIAELLP